MCATTLKIVRKFVRLLFFCSTISKNDILRGVRCFAKSTHGENQQWNAEMKDTTYRFGIRDKLILIFILIKVIPLILLAVFASNQVRRLGDTVKVEYSTMARDTQDLVTQIGNLSTENSIRALDEKAREAIERLSTDTARSVAAFLYERDRDVTFLSTMTPDLKTYSAFINSKRRRVVHHGTWKLGPNMDRWIDENVERSKKVEVVTPQAVDNRKEFHYRTVEATGIVEEKPLYAEVTFFDLQGMERIKVTTSSALSQEHKDISQKENTYCKAESYFDQLQQLGNEDIYVSDVIGSYIPSKIIGPYTPLSAKRLGIDFQPENSAYAGKENPVGKRFKGIIRWIKPVVENGRRVGYVSLALDHTHVMEFTDHLVPTAERYSPISDASSGNYAFMWDYKGRNISHPRDYFIVGYDPETGDPAVPWLSEEVYQQWKQSGLDFGEFVDQAPSFLNQSLDKKPSAVLTQEGMVGLDCRFLNFAPQCTGWNNLTQHGGSGSFVIFWSKLWKLTTAATIPYYTGQYKKSPRGFGFITIGANVHEFHSAANETARQITGLKSEYEQSLRRKEKNTLNSMNELLDTTHKNLSISTVVMVVLVMFIAIWMASTLTGKIIKIIKGIKIFQEGNLNYRLKVKSDDEMGQLAEALNEMSDDLQEYMKEMEVAKKRAEDSDKAKGVFLANMSHEIRTPLNAIIGMSRLALNDIKDDKHRYLLKTVRDSADSLLSLVNDILDFSKVEAGQLILEKHLFDLRDFMLSTIHTVSRQAKDKGLEFTYTIHESVPQFAQGDGLRLKQILLNVLTNAVKFTEAGSIQTAVELVDITEKTMRLKVTVQDTGKGIPSDMTEKVFKEFAQVDMTMTREHQGVGLGLAITRKLCQLMEGDIHIDCTQGVGCAFVFTIVLGRVEGVDLAPNTMLGERGEKKDLTVLVVEDNLANRDLARMILTGDGHRVVEATNGLDAIKKMAESNIDLIFMDIQMPTMDGLVATRIIRAIEKGLEPGDDVDHKVVEVLKQRLKGKHHPIIALTAHAMSGDREKCMAAGVDRYLTKPFLPEQILAAVNDI